MRRLVTARPCIQSLRVCVSGDLTLVHSDLIVVVLAVAPRDADPAMKPWVAPASQPAAAQLEPAAYFYVYFAVALHMAAERRQEALSVLIIFIVSMSPRRDEPIALHGLFTYLEVTAATATPAGAYTAYSGGGGVSVADAVRASRLKERVYRARRLIAVDHPSLSAI